MRMLNVYLLHLCVVWLIASCSTVYQIQQAEFMPQKTALHTIIPNATSLILHTERHRVKPRVVYSIVTLPVRAYSNAERLNNVHSIINHFPEVTIFRASHYLDVSCLGILSQMNVTVSPSYTSDEKGVGWVHAGKIGHWCSFLRFIVACERTTAAFCVWLEDDVVMTRSLMRTIRNHTRDYGTPVVALGKGDEVNVVVRRYTRQLLQHFTNYAIRGPLDVIQDNAFLRTSLYLFDARRYHAKQHSTLVCDRCPLLPVSEVNRRIHEARVRLHLSV